MLGGSILFISFKYQSQIMIKNETKLKALEEKKTDEMEMAA
jgi:hypothetical protein